LEYVSIYIHVSAAVLVVSRGKVKYDYIPIGNLYYGRKKDIDRCKAGATGIIMNLYSPADKSIDPMFTLEVYLECMKTHKANIMLIKKEILSRLTETSGSDPDRKKLKKIQGKANNAIKETQDAQTEVQEAIRNKK
jgi:hypothetical protein